MIPAKGQTDMTKIQSIIVYTLGSSLAILGTLKFCEIIIYIIDKLK